MVGDDKDELESDDFVHVHYHLQYKCPSARQWIILSV